MVPVAVNVTGTVEQVGFVPDVMAIDTAGVTTGFTVIVITALVATVGFTQAAFEVKTQVTTSPFTRVHEEMPARFVPAFTPFTFHC